MLKKIKHIVYLIKRHLMIICLIAEKISTIQQRVMFFRNLELSCQKYASDNLQTMKSEMVLQNF